MSPGADEVTITFRWVPFRPGRAYSAFLASDSACIYAYQAAGTKAPHWQAVESQYAARAAASHLRQHDKETR